jgi:translocator protein
MARLARSSRRSADEAMVDQLVLNFLWAPIFFSAHQIGLALVIVLLLLGAILAFMITSWGRDRVAAGLFVPYAAWVAFASVLNASIFMLN